MSKEKCPNKKSNEEDCPCTYTTCERHGVCCECISFHKNRKELPACLR
ncbi:MAG: hypothetical protein JW700_02830 [Candidatus Aenigmarchaeota archaeon]|nr:hypothetical protein [Candidatus Aenigmarchaeota archaeon]